MKKGKTSKINGFQSSKITYGTVDSIKLKSLYLNIQTWVEPIEEYDNWSRIVLNLSRSIKHSIYESLDRRLFNNTFIVDLDLRPSGISVGKKSFMNLEINFYMKDESIDFKSKRLKNSLINIIEKIYKDNLIDNNIFIFTLTKSKNKKESSLFECV
jgi:hypothetical protein